MAITASLARAITIGPVMQTYEEFEASRRRRAEELRDVAREMREAGGPLLAAVAKLLEEEATVAYLDSYGVRDAARDVVQAWKAWPSASPR